MFNNNSFGFGSGGSGGGGGSTNLTSTVSYLIGTDKPAGTTSTDAAFVGTTPFQFYILNNIATQWAATATTFNSGTGTWTFASALSNGDYISFGYTKP